MLASMPSRARERTLPAPGRSSWTESRAQVSLCPHLPQNLAFGFRGLPHEGQLVGLAAGGVDLGWTGWAVAMGSADERRTNSPMAEACLIGMMTSGPDGAEMTSPTVPSKLNAMSFTSPKELPSGVIAFFPTTSSRLT